MVLGERARVLHCRHEQLIKGKMRKASKTFEQAPALVGDVDAQRNKIVIAQAYFNGDRKI